MSAAPLFSARTLPVEFQNALNSLGTVPLEDALYFKSAVEASILIRIMSSAQPAPAPDELVDVEVLARRLNVSTDYVYDHADEFPFTVREGRRLLFSSRAIDEYIRAKGKNDSLTAKQQKRKLGLV